MLLSKDSSALLCHKLLSAPIGLLADPAHFPLKARPTAKDLAALPLLKEPADTSIAQVLRAHGSDVLAQTLVAPGTGLDPLVRILPLTV